MPNIIEPQTDNPMRVGSTRQSGINTLRLSSNNWFDDKTEPFSIEESDEMDSLSASTSTSKTVFSDLNDDCLLEVFKHLKLTDLSSAADVCRRFRQNAQSHLASTKHNNVLDIDNWRVYLKATHVEVSYLNALGGGTLAASKVLRNFGFLLRSIHVFGGTNALSHDKKDIFNLISFYCSDSLIELRLSCCNITENTLRPLLLHLQKLTLDQCKYSKQFGKMLPLWSPELRELKLDREGAEENRNGFPITMRLGDILRQSYRKLECVKLMCLSKMKNKHLEEFLRLNPQLKKIGITKCKNIDVNQFRCMVKHVPDLEAIGIYELNKKIHSKLKYVGKLDCLNTLELTSAYPGDRSIPLGQYDEHHTFMTSILNEIHASNVPLQHLHVLGFLYFDMPKLLVDSISKLKSLKAFRLFHFQKFEMSHILLLCEQLEELLELQLGGEGCSMSAEDLLGIVKCAPKLQSLHYFAGSNPRKERELTSRDYNKLLLQFEEENLPLPDKMMCSCIERVKEIYRKKCKITGRSPVSSLLPISFDYITEKWTYEQRPPGLIDLDAYMKMVRIVGQRKEKTRLLIKLGRYNSLAENITVDVIRKYNDTFTLKVVNHQPRFPSIPEYH